MRCMRWSLPLSVSFMAIGLASLAGCGQQKPEVAAKSKLANGKQTPTNEAPPQPIAEEECREFARRFVAALTAGDKPAVNTLIDWDAIFARATAGLDAPETVVSSLVKGMKAALLTNVSFADALIQHAKAGGRFQYLRTRNRHGRQTIVLRMLGTVNQGVNYVELFPKQGPDHKIRAVDVYPYYSGELMSQSIRRGLLPAVASQSRSFVEKLLGQEQDYVLDIPKLKPISEAILQGRKKDALRLLADLRPETKKSKMVMLMRTQAAQEADEKTYLATLEEFRGFIPTTQPSTCS